MQSDPRTQLARDALSAGTRSFRSALGTASEQVRGYLDTQSLGSNNRLAHLSLELGEFAKGRIDTERFAPFANWGTRSANPQAASSLEQALKTLTELASRGDDLFVVDVPSGGSLWHAVATALEEIGRCFSAARTVEACKSAPEGNPSSVPPPGPLSFRSWSKAQRRMAPPLVVHVDGSDLRVSGLAEFLDGRQKLVLVVRGESAPAPLVRMISPGTFVLQTTEGTGLDRLAAWDGPGVAALLPEGAACFIHDPAGGSGLSNRLQVTHVPAEAPRRALGGISAEQQGEELRQLADLATAAAGAAAGASAATASDPVDRLATWLIRQAHIS